MNAAVKTLNPCGLWRMVALAPQAEVLHNVRLDGRKSGTKRQIDVLVRQKVGQYEILIVIDCKDHSDPVDVKGVEEFYGLLEDVAAQKGVLVCPSGFTKTAKVRAEGLQIDLYSPFDTEPHKWQVTATIPALCDFRGAAIAFGLNVSAPAQFKTYMNFYEEAVVFDAESNALGTPLEVAAKRWNDGKFSRDVGVIERVPLFDAPTILMDNGYGQKIPVDIWVSLSVTQQLFYGQLPVPKISGFKDEMSGMVITNAFEIGLLDPDTVAREWKPIADRSEAEVRPVITLTGLLCWPQ